MSSPTDTRRDTRANILRDFAASESRRVGQHRFLYQALDLPPADVELTAPNSKDDLERAIDFFAVKSGKRYRGAMRHRFTGANMTVYFHESEKWRQDPNAIPWLYLTTFSFGEGDTYRALLIRSRGILDWLTCDVQNVGRAGFYALDVRDYCLTRTCRGVMSHGRCVKCHGQRVSLAHRIPASAIVREAIEITTVQAYPHDQVELQKVCPHDQRDGKFCNRCGETVGGNVEKYEV